VHRKNAKRFAYEWLIYDFFTRCAVNLLPVGPDDNVCVGAAAGVRLRVFVLFPLIFLCLIVVTAWGLAQNQTGWSIIVMNFVGSACLQLGYLASLVPSFLIISARHGQREHPQPVRQSHLLDRRCFSRRLR
jgi:hypothetical protein